MMRLPALGQVSRTREHHELTRRLIRIRPAGWSGSDPQVFHFQKVQSGSIWINSHCLSGSGTCISQVTRSVRVPASICGYPCKYLQVSTVTCRYNLWYRWLAAIVHFNIYTSHSSSLISPSSESTTVTSLSFSFPAFTRRHLSLKTWDFTFWNKPQDLTPCIENCWCTCRLIWQPMPKFAYSKPTPRKASLNVTWRC